MSYDIDDLLGLLDLEPIEFNIYRGRNRDIGSGRVFGGQVMGERVLRSVGRQAVIEGGIEDRYGGPGFAEQLACCMDARQGWGIV